MYLLDNKGGELKADFMSTDDFIRSEVVHKNIRLAHPEEIAAMKLEAITSRKEKKDYWDIFILLNEYSFSQLMDFYKERYPWNDIREVIESTGTSDKCDNQPDPLTFCYKEWAEVKLKIHSELQKILNKELK